nr:hypothetical protein [Nocardia brasiliensis]
MTVRERARDLRADGHGLGSPQFPLLTHIFGERSARDILGDQPQHAVAFEDVEHAYDIRMPQARSVACRDTQHLRAPRIAGTRTLEHHVPAEDLVGGPPDQPFATQREHFPQRVTIRDAVTVARHAPRPRFGSRPAAKV